MSRVRIYLGCSLDGYITGPNDDLSFLYREPLPGDPPAHPDALQFDAFMAGVGAMLMGRRTYDVVAGFGGWPYGETPVLVATHRPLEGAPETVRGVQGDIRALVAQARAAAGDSDVYLDGGDLARQGLEAGLVDEICLTFAPVLLGGTGVHLTQGLLAAVPLEFVGHHDLGNGMVQVTARVVHGG